MLKNTGFEILIASPSDYNELVAEIYFDGSFVARINQERGPGLFNLETPGPNLVEKLIIREVDWNGFREAVENACKRLKNENPNQE